MFIFKNAVKPFLLPPGIFITMLIFSGIWFFCKKNWKAGMVNFFIGLLMWTLSISPVSDVLLDGLVSTYNVSKIPAGDVIILLGGGIEDDVVDLTGLGAPSEESLARIVTAVRLYKRLNVPLIVSGGKFFRRKESEAMIMKRFLLDLGVPGDKIILEVRSRDTYENAKYTKEIYARSGYESPILVTSAYHLKRSILSFKSFGIDVMPFPAGLKSRQTVKYGWFDYLPGSFKVLSDVLHEYIGIGFYLLFYL